MKPKHRYIIKKYEMQIVLTAALLAAFVSGVVFAVAIFGAG